MKNIYVIIETFENTYNCKVISYKKWTTTYYFKIECFKSDFGIAIDKKIIEEKNILDVVEYMFNNLVDSMKEDLKKW